MNYNLICFSNAKGYIAIEEIVEFAQEVSHHVIL